MLFNDIYKITLIFYCKFYFNKLFQVEFQINLLIFKYSYLYSNIEYDQFAKVQQENINQKSYYLLKSSLKIVLR